MTIPQLLIGIDGFDFADGSVGQHGNLAVTGFRTLSVTANLTAK